jgi:hypothetical protein
MKCLLFIEADMWDPRASSVLNVSKAAGDRKKRQVTIYQVPKIIQGKKLLLYIEDDIWVPFCRSGLTFSKAARDRKKRKERFIVQRG